MGVFAAVILKCTTLRFVVGESIDDTYSKLKAQWVGDKDKVHMDSYMAVNDIDGYHIAIADTPQNRPERLYFVNLGAYEADKMAEQRHLHIDRCTQRRASQTASQTTLFNAHEPSA